MRRHVLLPLAVALALIAAACAGGSATAQSTSAARPDATVQPDPTTETTSPDDPARPASTDNGFPAGWTPDALDWTDCDAVPRGECAELAVPLDWADPDGETITLALGRVPASGASQGSLLTNPGGPGGSGLEFLGYDSFSTQVASSFDIVSWDPRGVGDSEGLSCGDDVTTLQTLDPDPDDAAEQAALDDAAEAVSRDCGATAADLLDHIGTKEVARDMEAIRLALGDEPLNYIGFSYGTQIGQQYAQFFPTEIRSMVLDGVVDPALSFTEFLTDQAQAFEAAFEHAADGCSEAGRRRCGVDDLAASYDRLAVELDREPLGQGRRQVGPAQLSLAAITASYNDDGWRTLGPALAKAQSGDGSGLRRLADSYLDFGGYPAYAGVVCTDSAPPRGAAAYAEFAEELRSAAPRFGGGVANEMLPCATWPAEPTGEPVALTAPGAPPILVVGNTRDAATPYDNAVAVADRLESGVLLTVDIGGHTAYSSDRCAQRTIDAYLVDLSVPASGTRCG